MRCPSLLHPVAVVSIPLALEEGVPGFEGGVPGIDSVSVKSTVLMSRHPVTFIRQGMLSGHHSRDVFMRCVNLDDHRLG
jgi:hypothetical protein